MEMAIFLRGDFLIFLTGFVVGALPVVVWNLTHDNLTSKSIFHKPWGVKKSLVELFTVGIPIIISNRRPFETKDLIPYYAVFVGFVYLLSYFYLVKARVLDWLRTAKEVVIERVSADLWMQHLKKIDLITLTTVSIIGIFSLSSPFNQFVIEPRYVSALNTVFPIVLVYFLQRMGNFIPNFLLVGAIPILFSNFYALYVTPPTHFLNQYDLKPLIKFLKEKDIRYVFGEYEYSYRLVFETGGKVIAVPIDSPPGEARYPRYRKIVEAAPKEQQAFVIMKEFAGDEKKVHRVGPFKIKLVRETE